MTSIFVRPEASATITVADPIIVVPGYDETVYSWGFESYATSPSFQVYFQNFETNTLDGWALTGGGKLVNTLWGGAPLSQGQRSLTVGGNGTTTTPNFSRTFTGLTVGRSYTVSAIGCALAPSPVVTTGTIGVDGIGTSGNVNLTNAANNTASYAFVATATSHVVRITTTNGGTGDIGTWDNITLTANTYVTNNGRDGFSSGTVGTSLKRTGNYAALMNGAARAFTGLQIGHQYTLRGWRWDTGTAKWIQAGATYTAASTAQSFSLPAGSYTWDDIELIHHVPPVVTYEAELEISEGKVRLDENYSPYVTANFTVPLTSLELLEQIDPRNPQRVTITTTEGVSGVTREYDLGLRSRTVDHKAGTIDIELASDEILLHDRKNVSTSVDSSARQHEASLRAVCNWALGKIGASLAPGTADADLTARWSAQNAILNPNGINGGGAFTQAGNATLSWSAANGVDGNPYPIITSAAAGQAFLAMPQTVNVKKGDMWTFSAYGNKSNGMTGTQNFILRVYEMDSTRSTVFRQIESTPVALPSSGGTAPYTWARADLTFTIQDPRTQALMIYVSAVATAGSQAFGFDRFMLTQGPLLLDFFSGTTAPAGYVTNWTGQSTPVVNNSVSERRPANGIERLPEVFNWTPGQSLFDFLQPLINTSGLRLFCDEERVWRLVDPADYEVPGYVVAQTGHNATEGTDSITRNDDTWADAVVCIYEWTDAEGSSRTAYDVAGDPNGKTITREINREYPGPGAAASILASFAGRGRTQSVTVVGQYAAAPGMDVTVNLPGTLTQTGKVRAVELDLGSGINRIETRGLTDALPGSWVLWNPTQTWSQVTPTLKWKDA
ncbi:hypothetical protein [Microbacterium sp. NPDC091662]|uniref:hypothetical protein n=1 Tax=Microbacterium sp. NPDC091662 TaxID=3364211 RepID=UPI00382C615B